MLPIWSIEVPKPCDTTPPQPFSRNEITAKPTMLAQHPASAAPPARPVRLSAAQIAADEMGRVSAMPTMTDTKTPITNGCCVVAHLITSPTAIAPLPMGEAMKYARPMPISTVTMGVTKMSIFVSFETILPHSAATTATTYTASGPPAPPMTLVA